MKNNTFFKKKIVQNTFYFIIIAVVLSLLWFGSNLFNLNLFVEDIELKTLDIRFRLPFRTIEHNDKIAILVIDDNSLEFLEEELGRWPWTRDVHALITETLVNSGAEAVVFDLMFLGHQKGFEMQDQILIDTLSKYNNVYIGMNFDNRQESNSIETINLIKNLSIKLENHSNITFDDSELTNCRAIIKELLESTDRIGIINHARDNDGISRRNSPLFRYHGQYYQYLATKVAMNYIAKRDKKTIDKLVITKDKKLLFGDVKIPLTEDGKILVNWYGPRNTYEYIPIWKVIKSLKQINEGLPPVLDFEKAFKGRIIFVGATASSLFDIKSTPYSRVHPGVELQTNILNNIINEEFLVRAPWYTNLIICILAYLITGYSVLRINSGVFVLISTITLILFYIAFASFVFHYMLIWLDIVYPLLAISVTFVIMYVIKYVIKSRDFEYTYKLATTDGLTNLHNHRYFQERMSSNIERCSRYKSKFSLLLVDIDKFKNFNDNYGHQAGDAVLKQVAQTLKKSVRSSDLVARYGGEEMAIVLENANTEEAILIANKICDNVANKAFRLSENLEKHVTISLGVATYPDHGLSPAELIEFSDKGLYRAKENGRNQVGSLYEDSNSESSVEEASSENNVEPIETIANETTTNSDDKIINPEN